MRGGRFEPVSDTGQEAERHSRLLGIKLRTLVAEHRGVDVASVDAVAEPATFPNGSALRIDDEAWVLVDGEAARSLGAALAWAVRQDAGVLHVVAEHDTGVLARRATGFRFPISVWYPEGRRLLPAVAEPLATPPPPSAEHLALRSVIADAGAEPIVERGVVTGEVRGLEVCRVVDREHTVQLEVGVGPNDREAFQLLHGDVPTVDALAVVVEAVAAHRSADAPQHPLNRMARERYLRWRLEQEPGLLDLVEVVPAEPPVARPSLKQMSPCVASGTDGAGRRTTVVCSVGVDLDLVPFVADVQAADPRRGEVVVALPSRDLVPLTVELAALLERPVELRAVD